MELSKKYLTTKELASELGKSENSIRYHIKVGRIKPSIKFGSTLGFELNDVIKQLKRDIK